MIYSFDIFDTIITRTTANPQGIFSLMQDELKKLNYSSFICDNFYDLRINAEKIALAKHIAEGKKEITIYDIYERLATCCELKTLQIDEIINLEFQTEAKNAIGISSTINYLKELVTSDNRVILISDMYLPVSIIRKILVNIDEIFKELTIYVSCECNETKRSGSIYNYIKQKEQVEYKNWIHCGDNYISDIQTAKELGIQTLLFEVPKFTKFEMKVIEENKNHSFTQLILGAIKNNRLFNPVSAVIDAGSAGGAILLYPYVYWIINQCVTYKIEKLYFIARDGYILKKIADIIISEYNFKIVTKYIYGSRKVWRILPEEYIDINKFLQHSLIDFCENIKEIADIFFIQETTLLSYLPEIYKDINILSINDIKEIKLHLIRNYDFGKFISETVMRKKEQELINYAKQEISFDNSKYAFVDLFGTGYTVKCLANVFKKIEDKKLHVFYFNEYCLGDEGNCIFHNFIPGDIRMSYLVETFCRAPHGQTEGYIKENNVWSPILENKENEALLKHGIEKYIYQVEKISELIVKAINCNNINASKYILILKYLNYLSTEPDEDIASFLGDMPHDGSGFNEGTIMLAPKLNKMQIFKIFLWRTSEPINRFYKGSSLEFSLLRCTEGDKRWLEFCQNNYYKSLGKCLRAFKKCEVVYTYHLPTELLSKRIILYAAGKVGQEFYEQITKDRRYKLVLWVDRNYKEFKKKHLNVSSIDKIAKVNYDQVLIAVLSQNQADSISNMLMEKGVPREKIIWSNYK